MSSPFTAAFLAKWRSNQTERVLLARIELATPSALTLNLADSVITTPDGTTWEGRIRSCEGIRFPGQPYSTGPDLASTFLVLTNARLSYQGVGAVLADSLSAYCWKGARVTLWYWPKGSAAADAAQVFVGNIDTIETEIDQQLGLGVRLGLIQDRSWDRRLPPWTINKVDDPKAPEGVFGTPKPIIYGDFSDLNMRRPWAFPWTYKLQQEESGCATGVVPAVLVNKGVGADKVEVLIAGHALKTITDQSDGHAFYIVAGDKLAVVDPTGGADSVGGNGRTFDDGTLFAYYGAVPNDVRTGGGFNTATDAKNACDVQDETSFAVMDQAAGANVLELTLPTGTASGTIDSMQIFVAASGSVGGDKLRVALFEPLTAYGVMQMDVTPTVPVQVFSAAWSDTTYGNNWRFGGDNQVAVDVRLSFTGGSGHTAEIYWIAIVAKYKPTLAEVVPAASNAASLSKLSFLGLTYVQGIGWVPKSSPLAQLHTTPGIYSLDGQFYAHCRGQADDGSGTWTGSAAALIERPADILRHLLVTYGAVDAADTETGAGAFGSFVDARSSLRAEQPAADDYVLAVHIGQKTTVSDAVKRIAEQSLCNIRLDPFASGLTGTAPRWRISPWRRGGRTDYARTLLASDLLSIRTIDPSDVGAVNALRIGYRQCYYRNKATFEAFVNATGSARGFNLPNVRDESLAVSAANDRLDWKSGINSYADTLTHATDQTPLEMAANLRAVMRAHDSHIHVGYGCHVATTFNDLLYVQVGATVYSVTLLPGDWTCSGFAEHVEDLLNAAGTGLTWTVTYDDATNLFTVTASGTFSILVNSYEFYSAAPTLGFNADQSGAATYTGAIARTSGRFWSTSRAAPIMWLFGTGSHAANSCATTIGYEGVSDVYAAYWQESVWQVGDLEKWCAESAKTSADAVDADYAAIAHVGEREEQTFNADCIRNEGVAQDFRNRYLRSRIQSPVTVEFTTYAMPDAQPMRVFKTDASLDDLLPYPRYGAGGAAGSWAGRKFRVVELELGAGPFWGQRIVAMEAD